MRAQHWALQNYVEKQSQKLKVIDGNEDEINKILNDDSTTCCAKKKKKFPIPTKTVINASLKRNLSISPQLIPPPAKKLKTGKETAIPKISPHNTYMNKSIKFTKPIQSKNNDEIVCTPDIMGLMSGNHESSQAPNRLQVPPLVMRQQQERGRPRAAQPLAQPTHPIGKAAIFHNVNGFQIDLNQAARQEIFRLPNGKLIQVRKQVTPTTPTQPRLRFPLMNPNGPPLMPRVTIRPNSMNRFHRPQLRAQGPRIILPQQRFTVENTRVTTFASQQQQQQNHQQQQLNHQLQQQQLKHAPVMITSSMFTQQNGSISVVRAPQPDTPLGKAKIEFEDKIISGMEVCQHTINKMITLTNSSSFKTSNSFQDIKGLYIHLQYLFTYTMGKYKSLQDSLTEGMETLAKLDPKLLDRDEEDIEILEEKTDCIEIESDDEEIEPVKKVPSPAKSVTASKNVSTAEVTNGVVATAKIPVPSFRHMRYIDKPKEIEIDAAINVEAELNVFTTKIVPNLDTPSTSTYKPDIYIPIKLKKCVVKLEKLENSDSIIIKNYMAEFVSKQNFSLSSSVEEVEKTDDITEEGKSKVQKNKNGAGPKSSKKLEAMVEIDDVIEDVVDDVVDDVVEDIIEDEVDDVVDDVVEDEVEDVDKDVIDDVVKDVVKDVIEDVIEDVVKDEIEDTNVATEILVEKKKEVIIPEEVATLEDETDLRSKLLVTSALEIPLNNVKYNEESLLVELNAKDDEFKEHQIKCKNTVEDKNVNQVDVLETSQANKENENLLDRVINESDLDSLLDDLTDLDLPNPDREFTV